MNEALTIVDILGNNTTEFIIIWSVAQNEIAMKRFDSKQGFETIVRLCSSFDLSSLGSLQIIKRAVTLIVMMIRSNTELADKAIELGLIGFLSPILMIKTKDRRRKITDETQTSKTSV